MPKRFRTGMYRKVLAAGSSLQVFSISLQSTDKADAEPTRQIRIFPIGLMATAPARIPENVDIRAPDSQALINVTISVAALAIVLGLEPNI